MKRRSFLGVAAAVPLAACLPAVLASKAEAQPLPTGGPLQPSTPEIRGLFSHGEAVMPRHRVVDIRISVSFDAEHGRILAKAETTSIREAETALEEMRQGDTVTLTVNGETVGTVEA